MLKDLGHEQEEATKLLCHNNSTIALLKNVVFHKRTKHIDTRYHYIRELINAREIIMEQCRITDQFMNIFTKPLGTRLFEQQRVNLGISNKKVEIFIEELKVELQKTRHNSFIQKRREEVENLSRLRGSVKSIISTKVGAMCGPMSEHKPPTAHIIISSLSTTLAFCLFSPRVTSSSFQVLNVAGL